MREVYKTYQFYTKKNQRISAYAEFIEGKLHITLLMCSKNDEFQHAISDNVFLQMWSGMAPPTCPVVNGITYHPEFASFEVTDHPKRTFIEWMEKTYYRKGIQILQMHRPVLYKGTGYAERKRATSRFYQQPIIAGKAYLKAYKLSER